VPQPTAAPLATEVKDIMGKDLEGVRLIVFEDSPAVE